MKTVKKLLALLLAMVMILGMLPLGTLAQENGHDHLEGCAGEDCTAEGCTCRCHYRHLDTCLEGCTGTLAEGETCECDCHFVHMETCLADCTGTVEVDGQTQECACECHDHIEECVENCVGETKDGEACACSCHHTVESCTLDCAGEDCDCVCHQGATLNQEKPAPETKCETCGSTEHTTENHPKEEPKDETKCATCNSTEHTTENHPKEERKDETKCATCNSTEHTTENHPAEETKCGICGSAEHTTENHPADVTKCGICGGGHADADCTYCLLCKGDNSQCVICEECGTHAGDHTSTCTKRPCETCKKNPCECACETCGKFPCECPEVCEHCGVELVEGVKHKEDCLSLCTCEEGFKVHGSKCPLADSQEIFAYYEQELSKLAEESKTIASGLDKNADDYADKLKKLLDDYTAKLMECYGDSYYYYEDDVFTADQDSELLAIVEGVLAYLNEEFGYDYQTGILNLPNTLTVDTKEYKVTKEYRALTPTTNTDIKINLFDYSNKVNESQAGRSLAYILGGGNVANMDQKETTSGTAQGMAPSSLNLIDGYPAMTSNSGSGWISTEYFFDKTLDKQTKLPKDQYTITTTDGTTTKSLPYDVARFEVEQGSLFSIDSEGYHYYDSKENHAVFSFQDGKGTMTVYDYAVSPYSVDSRYSEMGHFLPFNGNLAETYNNNQSKYVGTFIPIKIGGSFQAVGNATAAQMEEIYSSKIYVKDSTGNWPFQQAPYKVNNDLYSIKSNDPLTKPITVTADDGTKTTESIAIHDGLKAISKEKYAANMWIGMTVDTNFVQPKDGKVGDNDMIYEFSGDDNLWLYIDGVRVLDIANHGKHDGYAGGAKWATINFATGEVVVYMVDASRADVENSDGTLDVDKTWTHNNGKTYYYVGYKTTLKECFQAAAVEANKGFDGSIFNENGTFKDYTTHTFNLFYQDVGQSTSNCYMRFNIKTIASADASLTKSTSGINESVADNQTYSFNVTAKTVSGDVFTNLSYYILENGEEITDSQKTIKPVGGVFTVPLKAGQTAMFTNVSENTIMTFAEEDVAENIAGTPSWTINGNIYTAKTEVRLDNYSTAVNVTCTNPRKTGSLSVTKAFEGQQLSENDKFPMKIAIGDIPYTGTVTIKKDDQTINEDRALANTPGVFLLKTGETLTVSGIPTEYTYTVEELDPNNIDGNSAYGYLYKQEDTDTRKEYPLYDNATGTITADNTSAVKVTNKHVVADLKIIKDVNVPDVDAGQSFLFLVEGPAGYKQHVVIQGSGSKAITKLPVGEYTVTELTDWSWRYELAPENSITLLTGTGKQIDGSKVSFQLTRANEAVTFKNVRNETLWLDGNAYCDNAFTG